MMLRSPAAGMSGVAAVALVTVAGTASQAAPSPRAPHPAVSPVLHPTVASSAGSHAVPVRANPLVPTLTSTGSASGVNHAARHQMPAAADRMSTSTAVHVTTMCGGASA